MLYEHLLVSCVRMHVYMHIIIIVVSVYDRERASYMHIHNNNNYTVKPPNIMDMLGTQPFILCREVVLFRRLFCMECI